MTVLALGDWFRDQAFSGSLVLAAPVAAVAGLRFAAPEPAREEAAERSAGVSALLFLDFDGRRRAVALACVDRVETVPSDAIRLTGY